MDPLCNVQWVYNYFKVKIKTVGTEIRPIVACSQRSGGWGLAKENFLRWWEYIMSWLCHCLLYLCHDLQNYTTPKKVKYFLCKLYLNEPGRKGENKFLTPASWGWDLTYHLEAQQPFPSSGKDFLPLPMYPGLSCTRLIPAAGPSHSLLQEIQPKFQFPVLCSTFLASQQLPPVFTYAVLSFSLIFISSLKNFQFFQDRQPYVLFLPLG